MKQDPHLLRETWFIRHGESTSNAGEVAHDRGSTVLTPLGEEQAKAASLRVMRRPDLVVVTPYIRTRLTAQPLLARYPEAPCETWDLQEFSALSEEAYVGKTWMERRPHMLSFWERNDPHYVHGAGAESFADFTGRLRNGLNHLQARDEAFTIVFAHGYVLQTIRLMLRQPEWDLRELMSGVAAHTGHSPVENCEIIRAGIDTRGMRLFEDKPAAAS